MLGAPPPPPPPPRRPPRHPPPLAFQPYAATVAFDFAAENEEELTVRAGDRVVAVGEVDGWVAVEKVDGGSGLVPGGYVRRE